MCRSHNWTILHTVNIEIYDLNDYIANCTVLQESQLQFPCKASTRRICRRTCALHFKAKTLKTQGPPTAKYTMKSLKDTTTPALPKGGATNYVGRRTNAGC